jgi:hypothetical protein
MNIKTTTHLPAGTSLDLPLWRARIFIAQGFAVEASQRPQREHAIRLPAERAVR